MKLLLSGGGGPEQVKELDNFFAKEVGNGKVLYIPVAMEKIPYDDCFKWFKSTYAEYGIVNIEMCTELDKKIKLDDYSAIFIGGGNTFKLINEMRKTGFDKKIIDYIKNDGLVYGGSAGAIIFGESIDTALHADKNYLRLNNFAGLNIIDGYKIWCHYNIKDESDLKKIKGKIIVLYEESGLFYDGVKMQSIGKSFFIVDNK
jgi:dipeptidase E